MTDPSAVPPPPPSGGFAPPPPVAGVAGATEAGLQLSTPGKRFGGAVLEGVLFIITLGIGWVVWWVILWSKGQTPAKSLLKMRCVMLGENRPAGLNEMAMRELVGKVLLGFIPLYNLVGAIFVLTDDNNQALWDKVGKTTVVDDPDNRWDL